MVDRIRDNPLPAVGIAFAAGLALSQSGADRKAADITSSATRDTGSKLGEALDTVVASLVTGVAAAFQERIDEAMQELATVVRGKGATGAKKSGNAGAPSSPD